MTNTPESLEELTTDAIESLRCGFADIDAGRSLPLRTAQEQFQAVFAARFPMATDGQTIEE